MHGSLVNHCKNHCKKSDCKCDRKWHKQMQQKYAWTAFTSFQGNGDPSKGREEKEEERRKEKEG